MLTRARLLVPALAALSLLLTVAPLGCGGDASETADADSTARPDLVTPKLPKLPRIDDTEGAPPEPLVFPMTPLSGDVRINVGVKVAVADGKHVKLKTLLRDPSVLIYNSPTVRGRAARATTRVFIRPLARSAAQAGFRVVVLFEKGTSYDEVATWYEKRRVPETVVWAIDDKAKFASANEWDVRTAALIDTRGTIGLLFPPEDGEWHDRVGTHPTATSDLLAEAWRLPDAGPTIDDATVQAASALALATLSTTDSTAEVDDDVSFEAQHDVWVSLFRPGDFSRLRGRAAPGPLGPAVVTATKAALASAGDKEAEWRADAANVRVQIDVLGAEGPIVTTGEKSLWYLMEPGVHGVRMVNGEHEAVLLPSEPKSMGLLTPRVRARKDKHRRLLGSMCREVKLKTQCWRKPVEVDLFRFRSTSFGIVEPGKPAVRIFRGNVLWEGDPTETQILDSIQWGGRWLVRTVQEDGKFDYENYPNQADTPPGYNIVRHAGSVYGLFEMGELAAQEPHLAGDQDAYFAAAALSIGYVYDGLKPPKMAREGRICLLGPRGGCDSGSAALSLLTFLVRPDPSHVPEQHRAACFRDDDEALMEGLGRTLLDMIDDDGHVWRRYQSAMTQDKVKKEPLYYPGESMLALVRFYEETGDERWLEGARAIANAQMDGYKKNRMMNPDHWVMQGLYRLWRIDKRDRYAEMAYAMGVHYSAEQYGEPGKYGPVWTPWPDYLGAYRRTNDLPRTTRAGSRSEALRAVTNLAWERGDDAVVYEEALLGAARHLMEQQYTDRNGYWIPDLERVHGAYPMGVIDNHVRIDNNQHALVGMVGALHVLRRRAAQ